MGNKDITLVCTGNTNDYRNRAYFSELSRYIKENNLELGDTQIIDPAKSDKTSEYAKELYELRKENSKLLEKLAIQEKRIDEFQSAVFSGQ